MHSETHHESFCDRLAGDREFLIKVRPLFFQESEVRPLNTLYVICCFTAIPRNLVFYELAGAS